MSGGVDSSYCAHLLLSQGYEVIGLYLKLHDKEKNIKFTLKIANKSLVSLESALKC